MKRRAIDMTDESAAEVTAFAKREGLTEQEAYGVLVAKALRRVEALQKYERKKNRKPPRK